MLRQTINNLFWINKGGEWYSNAVVGNQFGEWRGPVRDYSVLRKLEYIFMYRIVTVWANWRDWGSAIISSIALALMFSLW